MFSPTIRLSSSVVALVGRLAGAALAAALLLCLSARMIGVVFALCVLAAVACSGAGWRLSASRRNVALAGIASGVMSTVTSAGGPPFAIVMQQLRYSDEVKALGEIPIPEATVSPAELGLARQFISQRAKPSFDITQYKDEYREKLKDFLDKKVRGEAVDLKPAEAPVAKVVDTTGAGDLFAAGFLFGLAQGKGLADCGKLGALAAAEIISHYGARPEVSLKDLAAKAKLI